MYFGTFGTFGKKEQHKTISFGSPIIHTSSHPRMYVFLLSYVRGAKNLRTSPKKLTYDNGRIYYLFRLSYRSYVFYFVAQKINRMSQP